MLEGEDNVFFINPLSTKNKIIITSPDDFEKYYPDSKINCFASTGTVDKRIKEILDRDFHYIQHPDYYEVTLKGNSKSRGMEIVLKHLGMTVDDSIAIGDSLNDLDMLQFAGFSIAMGNSPEEVIKACDAVTKSVDEGGVAAALYKYVLGI